MAHPPEDITMPCAPYKAKMKANKKKNMMAKKKKKAKAKKNFPPKTKGPSGSY